MTQLGATKYTADSILDALQYNYSTDAVTRARFAHVVNEMVKDEPFRPVVEDRYSWSSESLHDLVHDLKW